MAYPHKQALGPALLLLPLQALAMKQPFLFPRSYQDYATEVAQAPPMALVQAGDPSLDMMSQLSQPIGAGGQASLLQQQLLQAQRNLASQSTGGRELLRRNEELEQRLSAAREELDASAHERLRLGSQLNAALDEGERLKAGQQSSTEVQMRLSGLVQERAEFLGRLKRQNQTAKALQEQLKTLQQQRDEAASSAHEFARREHAAEQEILASRQKATGLAEQLRKAQDRLDSLAGNFTQQLQRLQDRGMSLPERSLLGKMQVERDELMQREGKYKALLERTVQREALEQEALAAAQAEASRAGAELNRTHEESALIQVRLAQAETLLQKNRQGSLLQRETQQRLEAGQANLQRVQAELEEERAARKKDQEASRELVQQRDADRATLERSGQLLRGGAARLALASKELQETEGRARQLQARNAEQEALLNRSQALSQTLQQQLVRAHEEMESLSSKASLLEARAKTIRMMPWAELLGRCQADVCFTLAHSAACCGGPKDIVAQRPDACDLAARLAAGEATAPEACA